MRVGVGIIHFTMHPWPLTWQTMINCEIQRFHWKSEGPLGPFNNSWLFYPAAPKPCYQSVIKDSLALSHLLLISIRVNLWWTWMVWRCHGVAWLWALLAFFGGRWFFPSPVDKSMRIFPDTKDSFYWSYWFVVGNGWSYWKTPFKPGREASGWVPGCKLLRVPWP